MWAKIVAIGMGVVGCCILVIQAITGIQLKRDFKAMSKVQEDYDKIDKKHAADNRSDDDVLKGGVK